MLLLFMFIVFKSSQAQISFELPLYFEDAMGNRDTVVIGAAPDATDSTDMLYGEVEYMELFDTVLDIRVRHGDIGSHPNWNDMPLYKRIIQPDEDWTTSSYIFEPIHIVAHAKYPPLTVAYDSTVFGQPSLVNILYDHTGRSPLVQFLSYWISICPPNDTTGNLLYCPPYHCMMNTSRIVHNFDLHRWFLANNAIHGLSTYIPLVDSTWIWTAGAMIESFTSWADNYYCERISSTDDVPKDKLTRSIVKQNPAQDVLYLCGDCIDDIQSYTIYNMSGQVMMQESVSRLPSSIDIGDWMMGPYAIVVEDRDGYRIGQMWLKQ